MAQRGTAPPPETCHPWEPTGVLDREAAGQLARLFKAVADPARLRIIAAIRSAPGQHVCVCELTGPLGLTQPTVSHHLRILSEAGVVSREQRGTWAWFSLVPERLDVLAEFLAHAEATP